MIVRGSRRCGAAQRKVSLARVGKAANHAPAVLASCARCLLRSRLPDFVRHHVGDTCLLSRGEREPKSEWVACELRVGGFSFIVAIAYLLKPHQSCGS